MKKQILLVLVLLMITLCVKANYVKIDGINYNLISKTHGAEVVAVAGHYVGDIIIPETIRYEGVTYKVTSIGANAFALCTEMTSIKLPNNLTSIGANAFDNCNGLKTIVFPPNLKTIDYGAFMYCTNLTSIKFNNKLKTIESDAFRGCYSLSSITIPGSVVTIKSRVFADCKNLAEATIGNGIKTIESDAFENCKNLITINLPSSLTYLSGFNGCTNLSSILIPASVMTIGSSAFFDCSILNNVIIPENVKVIESAAFAHCINLSSIKLPQNVQKIYDMAFYDCINLKSITIESTSYVEIQELAFADCHELRDFYCYTKSAPSSYNTNFFEDSYIEYSTLHVPSNLINYYKSIKPWKSFKSIVPLPQVTYIVDGEIYKIVIPIMGETIILEQEPTKEGYTFSGWSEIPETMPEYDITVTGAFTINKYKLTYQLDGMEYMSSEIEYGSAITPPSAPEREGYTFEWIDVPETMPAHDITITGAYAINQYTITYKIDDEIFRTDNVDYGSTITPPEAPVREGYTFEWIDVPETMPSHDITIVGSYTSGINAIKADDEDMKWYTFDGNQSSQPHKGLNIVRMSNGKTKKVVVKIK